MTYPRQTKHGEGLEEVPASVTVLLITIALSVVAVGFGPSFCAWDARVQKQIHEEYAARDRWDRACSRSGGVMTLGKGSTPDAICVVNGRIIAKR